MTPDTLQEKIRNILVIFLLLIVTLVCMVQEDYLTIDAGGRICLAPGPTGYLFWLTLCAGFLLAFWLALSISTRRLVLLILSTLVVEYCGQTIGTSLKLWTYPISGGSYFFGILLWVVTVLFAYTGATKSVVKLCMASRFKLASTLNPLILMALLAVIWLSGPEIIKTFPPDSSEPGKYSYLFWVYLAVLGLIGTIACLKNDFRVVTGIVITAWIVGVISESSGASAGIWTFGHPDGTISPPVYLVIGCWPFEILAIFALSAFLAGEPLIPSASPPPRGIGSDNETGPSTFNSSSPESVNQKHAFPGPDGEIPKSGIDVPGTHQRASAMPASSFTPQSGTDYGTSDVPLTDEERVLRVFLLISSIVYLVLGIVFLLKPEFVVGFLESIGTSDFKKVLDGAAATHPKQESRFWVTMTFSMMMTIAFLSFYAQRNIRKNKLYVIPLLLAKGSSATSAFLYFLFVKIYFPFLVIFLVDGVIFLLTVHFFVRACSAWLNAQTIFFWEHQASRTDREVVKVASFKGDNKLEVLDKVLEATEFFKILDDEYKLAEEKHKKMTETGDGKLCSHPDGDSRKEPFSRDRFSVAIKPNFMFMHAREDISSYTDPELVEHLVDRLCQEGYKNVTIVESQSALGNYYANRDVKTVAAIIGFSGTTSRGKNPYRIADLTLEMVPHDYKGRLGLHYAGLSWKNAHFRISFAKNKTHTFCAYTLALKNIYGTLPLQDKMKHYHTQREYDWPTIESMKPEIEGGFPVHFALIDAYVSADGQFGVLVDPEPNWTKTIIGGGCPIAVDEVGCSKMGLDPNDLRLGRFYHLAVKMFGKPNIKRLGDLSVYEPWENVSQIYIKSLDLIEEDYHFSNWGFSILTACSPAFPFKVRKPSVLFLRWLLKPLKRMYYRYDAL